MESEAPEIDKSPDHIRGLTVGIRICWMARHLSEIGSAFADSYLNELGISKAALEA